MNENEASGTRVCNRCGLAVVESDLEQYPYLCLRCDENLYAIETRLEKEVWEPDLDYAREYAVERVRRERENLASLNLASLTPLQRAMVEGTVAYVVETWYSLADVWVRRWDEDSSLPAWDDLDGAAKNRAIAAASYEHFKRDMDSMDDLFVERMMSQLQIAQTDSDNRALER